MDGEQDVPAPAPYVAVVTGAGSGIGPVVARALAGEGLRVALVGRRRARLEEVRDGIRQSGGAAEAFPCDVGRVEEVAALKQAVDEQLGPAQVLFNGAGLHTENVSIAESTPERWIETLNVNLVGPYLMCRAFTADMVRLGWGRIINVSSAASVAPPGNLASIYQLSKVALNHFTRQLARELDGTGVTANAIHPGEVKTEMWAAIKTDAASRTGPGRNALGWADMVEQTGGDPPEKTAELVLELLRPSSDGVNGEFLWIKDGIQKPRPAW
jgi:NAD(P)-dependent dehydrogenase (short-subunit alcohol dehydrogenase family)